MTQQTPLLVLCNLFGYASCHAGLAFDEPMRIHQPRSLYYGMERWLDNAPLPHGIMAQHGYYRERSDCAAYVQAVNVGDARRRA